MGEYAYLLYIAIILLSTKLLGIVARKLGMPQVVGALFAGIILGPSVLNMIPTSGEIGTFITYLAELGVIFLMFAAGLETDMQELKKNSVPALIVASIGVLVPLAGGFAAYAAVFHPDLSQQINVLKAVFIGVVLSATSVSITVETLREMGKLNGKVGTTILGAAVIDDILGIIALTIVTSMADSSVSLCMVLLKIVGFFAFALIAGVAFYYGYKKWEELTNRPLHRHAIMVFVFCLLLSYCAEVFFGVADITGAFVAGLVVSKTQRTQWLASKFDTISYMLLSPLFFASIGIKVVLPAMNGKVVGFTVVLVIVAVLTKVLGCGLGAKVCGYKNYQCARIGVGMISRGEVALIVADKGSALGLMGSSFLGPVVIVVVITTIITPILLKFVFRFGPNGASGTGALASNYEQIEKYREGEMEK